MCVFVSICIKHITLEPMQKKGKQECVVRVRFFLAEPEMCNLQKYHVDMTMACDLP